MDDNLGGLIDRMNVRLDLEPDDLVTDVVLICKVVSADGDTSLGLATSEGLCWIDQLGLMTAAMSAFNQGYTRSSDVDDDE